MATLPSLRRQNTANLQAALDQEQKHAQILANVGAVSPVTHFYFPASAGSLINAHAAHYRQGGARALVLQIDDFLERPQARERLEAVHRDADVAPAVVDALIALEPRVKALRSRSRLDEAPPMDQKTGENHEP